MGGDIVPDVIVVCVSVVRITSMSVRELYRLSYLVGVVMVVRRPFSSMRCVNASCGVSAWRLMLMSPMTVIEVNGVFVCISVIVFCNAAMKSGLQFVLGLLYVPMMVCMGFVFVSFLCICMIMLAVLLIVVSDMVMCRLFL